MIVIYALECIKNGKVYIGCSGDYRKRMREHRSLLKNNKHAEPELQADFNKFGIENFQMIPILCIHEDFDVDTKRAFELHWMDHYLMRGLLYNTKRISFQPPDGAPAKAAKKRVENGYRPSVESNLKRSLAQLGKPKGHGAKISATKQAKKLMR